MIEHAYGGEPDNPIELRLEIVDESSLTLKIRDQGTKFDLARYEAPNLSEPHEGGYGVLIIRSVMDSVDYDTSAERGTTLTLVKRRSNPPA